MEAKEASTKSGDPKKVPNQKGNSKDKRLNIQNQMLGADGADADAKKSAFDQIKSQEKIYQ